MEIMEDGNLVDRVRILLQRDMEYYQEKQTVLREPLCIRVCGGKLDFPRHASLAAVKIVTWWESEFEAAFKCQSGLGSSETEADESSETETRVVKKIQPSEFIESIVDTAEQLLEHLHLLIQECLDHADLTVLTATLGAAALIRNCLWCYSQHAKNAVSPQTSEKINKTHKSYYEMAEAVAERLLDLHCRLISLYILNEADSLSWQNDRPFFECERCSFVIQMWWLYMQGTKKDLWGTVPPKMAQRVFSGMLNESLSIITPRFIYGRPTLARSKQFWTDAFNVLCCTSYLALGACVSSNEMIGMRLNKLSTSVRDIHAKCNELLICLLLRGTPLKDLYQAFRKGFENLIILQPRRGPAPWLLTSAPNLLGIKNTDANFTNLPEDKIVILELNVLRNQPQPNWPQLMKVISMSNFAVAKILLKTLVHKCIGFTSPSSFESIRRSNLAKKTCGGFLCSASACDSSLQITSALELYSLFFVIAITVNIPEQVIVPALKLDPKWFGYLDRQQVWNQSRPPWLNAIVDAIKNVMLPVVEALVEAVKTGASIYQAMSLVIGCFTELFSTLPIPILRTTFALNSSIPAHCHPIGDHVLLQVLCASLYTALLEYSVANKKVTSSEEGEQEQTCNISIFDPNDIPSTAIALAEAVCSIDEDNKHTAQIDDFVELVREFINAPSENFENSETEYSTDEDSRHNNPETIACIIEMHTDELLFNDVGRRSLKVAHQLLMRSSDQLLINLSQNKTETKLSHLPEYSPIEKPLTYIMFHIGDTFFDQFLTAYEATNWKRVLTMPLSITLERARSQVLLRPEFKNIGELSLENREVIHCIKRLLSTVKSTRF